MKKMFKCMLFSIMLFSFSTIVKAANIDLSNPSRTCRDDTDGNTICNKAIAATYWDNSYFANDGYIGDSGSGGIIYKSINFQWDDINLCKGKSILITGYVAGLFDFFNNSYSVDVYNNGSKLSCSYSLENSSRLKYTCSGTGGGKFQINLNQYEFPLRGVYTVGVSKVVDISCDSSNADVITSNNNNTKDIIDNNNKNADKITDSVNKTNDTIKDGSVDSAGITALTETKLPTSGIFSAILNLPVQFFQSLLDNLSTTTCKNIEFTLPYVDQDVSIPCVRKLLEQLNALTFYETIGALVGGIAIFNYLMYMGKQFTKMELLQHTNAEFGGL